MLYYCSETHIHYCIIQYPDRADESAQAEVKRLLSRVQFLESMLKGKEDSIVQLEGRMEELRLERDSYREAMMKVY